MPTIKLNGPLFTCISGSAGHCKFMLQGKPFGNNKFAVPAAGRRQPRLSAKQKMSRLHGKRLKSQPAQIVWEQGEYCACNAYLVADYLWTSGLIDKDLWRRAVKRPRFSCYDLWLYESVGLMRQGLYLPDVPSISGGFSRNHLVPGTVWQPPADCLNMDITQPHGTYRWTTGSDPPIVRQMGFYGVEPDMWPGEPLIEPTECRWFWNPSNRNNYVSMWQTWNPSFSAVKADNPIYPTPPRMEFINIYITVSGRVYHFSHTHFDLATLIYASSIPQGIHQAAGHWE